jgi:hypothetical protein
VRKTALKFIVIGIALFALVVVGVPWLRTALFYRGVFGSDVKANQSIVFYGKVVDQDGAPVGGATVNLWLDVFNHQLLPSSTGRGRSRRVDLKVISGVDGSFSAPVTAFTLRIDGIKMPDYIWIRSTETGVNVERGLRHLQNRYFALGTLGGFPLHRTDPSNPAVFVLLRKDLPLVTRVQMSRGGWERNNRTNAKWIRNEPFWPLTTDPEGVDYVGPTTMPGK